jgi:formate hydrogenlyase subunit 6/NADH:ubiquinone oxidoreductase subunit I
MLGMFNKIFRNLGSRPATRRYPFQKRDSFAGSRGRLEIDIASCIFCGMCAKRCPANALSVSRDPKSWTLDPYCCILCAYCVEVCPKKCLHMNPRHGVSDARAQETAAE